jgi:hypothetical protein
MLEQQREDLEVTLAEIEAHEAQCRRMLEAAAASAVDKPAGKLAKKRVGRQPENA